MLPASLFVAAKSTVGSVASFGLSKKKCVKVQVHEPVTDPSRSIIPALSPKVYTGCLHRAIWIPKPFLLFNNLRLILKTLNDFDLLKDCKVPGLMQDV